MSAFSFSTSSSSAGSSLHPQSCVGAMPTPSFSSVPTYGVLSKSAAAGRGSHLISSGREVLQHRGEVVLGVLGRASHTHPSSRR